MILPENNNAPNGEDKVLESDLKQALNLISSVIQTRGIIPEILPGTQEEQVLLRSLLMTLKSSQYHLLELSDGKLDSNIELRGTFGGALNSKMSS